MKKKLKNVLRDANMRNFSLFTTERYIIIDEDSTDEEKDKFVKAVNERLWSAIQEVNALATGRILPYVTVRRAIKDEQYIRIIINDIDSTTPFNDIVKSNIKIDELTHLINFKTLSPQRQIIVSDDAIPGDAKMIIDKNDQLSAAIDIFLDIAMFNSFSFLSDMPHEEKRDFNNIKYSYFREINEDSYFHFSEASPPSYYSFSFSARTDGKTIDYVKYVDLWEKFIHTHYKEKNNIVPPVSSQLKLYREVEQIDKIFFDDEFWLKQGNGDFLLIRTNREPNTYEEKDRILNYMGKTEFHVGGTTVVPISEYFNPFLRKRINELYISAYKIVNQIT